MLLLLLHKNWESMMFIKNLAILLLLLNILNINNSEYNYYNNNSWYKTKKRAIEIRVINSSGSQIKTNDWRGFQRENFGLAEGKELSWTLIDPDKEHDISYILEDLHGGYLTFIWLGINDVELQFNRKKPFTLVHKIQDDNSGKYVCVVSRDYDGLKSKLYSEKEYFELAEEEKRDKEISEDLNKEGITYHY